MSIKPWYNLITPREDLREGKPLDAAEFAVHLDHIRDNKANEEYQNPERFFERTFLTNNLKILAAGVLRRLSGITTETSAVYNMSTQFGGGKTHALTLLYHLVSNGTIADSWVGVSDLKKEAGISSIPQTATAIFVGTEFDTLKGRGGNDGTPHRKTPWGEIAWQLGGNDSYSVISDHDNEGTAPGGDVIRQFLPADKPCLILMDEVMNYVGRVKNSKLLSQFYNFMQNLTETARRQKNIVLVVSIPASELEMSADDRTEFDRLKKLLDRLGKAITISSENETSEIIRRRLFDWDLRAVGQDGRVLLSTESIQVCNEYADWLLAHRQQIPNSFQVDQARQIFVSTYPFHPVVLSVFERKWQTLPRFQQTRGILRLLALWVSHAFSTGFKGAFRDPLISLGTAPLQDSLFRRAVFEQLGEDRLEAAIASDIAGKSDAFAVRLDKEAIDNIKKTRLHQKVATSIFFESSGGQQHKEATLPEIRLAVGEPALDIGNIETVLEELTSQCYYLNVVKNKYRFSISPNLNKILSDRRATVEDQKIRERVRDEIRKVIAAENGYSIIFFPERSNQIPDKPALSIVVLDTDNSFDDKKATLEIINTFTKEYGNSGRVNKTGLIWLIPESKHTLEENARKLLAWESIRELDRKDLDDSQIRQLEENLAKSKRDLRESVWKSYNIIGLLEKNNEIQIKEMGLVHSSAATSIIDFVFTSLKQFDLLVDFVAPTFLLKNWPPALNEWSTKSVRDMFYQSPLFPRLLNPEKIKDTIAKGVTNGLFAYVGKGKEGKYEPFIFEKELDPIEVEISEDMYIISSEDAKRSIEPPRLKYIEIQPKFAKIQIGSSFTFTVKGIDQFGHDFPLEAVQWVSTTGEISDKGVLKTGHDTGEFVVYAKVEDLSAESRITLVEESEKPETETAPVVKHLSWNGEVPSQKWMNFYTNVVSNFVSGNQVKIKISIDVNNEEGISEQKIEELKSKLRDMGLDENVSM